MPISVSDFFTICIALLSSLTVGPIQSATLLAEKLDETKFLDQAWALKVHLYISFGAPERGKGA